MEICRYCKLKPVAPRSKSRCVDCLKSCYSSRDKQRTERKTNGQCVECGKPRVPTNTHYCAFHAHRFKILRRARTAAHRGAALCTVCSSPKAPNSTRCEKHLVETRERARAYRWRYRGILHKQDRDHKLAIMHHYGDRCACCGEENPAFWTIDHIEGGGNAHRREIGRGGLLRWLKKNNYPAGFQILCCNCNFAKWRVGICPHRLARESLKVDTMPYEGDSMVWN